jgi:hypothetical protein
VWRALLLPGALATAWIGCASLQGLSGGGGGDAGPDVASGFDASDAPSESASGTDAADAYGGSDAFDGALDAGSAADALDAASPFCASLSPAPAFCDDFDEGTALAADWSYFSIAPPDAGTVAVDTGAYVSPPASLAAQIGAGTANGNGLVAQLNKQFVASSSSSAHLEYRLRIDAVDSVENELFSQLAFKGGAATPYILDVYLGQGAVLEEEIPGDGGVTFKEHPLATQPTVGVWSLLTLDVDFVNVTVKLTIDGTVAFEGGLDPGYNAGTPLLTIGVGYYAGPPRTVSGGAGHFDNVVLDFN